MKQKKYFNSRSSTLKKGGLINTLINQLPFELYIPGYNCCGPGTKWQMRLVRNDLGINPLDEACKVHDIAYATSSLLEGRHKAGKILEEVASRRLSSGNAGIGEKMVDFGVKGAMKVKRKLGMRLKKKTKPKLEKVVPWNRFERFLKKRVIPTPRKGGFLPFLLRLLGAVGGGAVSIAKVVNDAKTQSQQLEEEKRHNLAMEAAKGKDLYLRPYKRYGYLKPFKKYPYKATSSSFNGSGNKIFFTKIKNSKF